MPSSADIVRAIREDPSRLAPALGFDLLNHMHSDWMRDMVFGTEDRTLQAHRGSYKTTCVSLSLWLLMILRPNARIAFFRKTDSDVKEVIMQVQKMFQTDVSLYVSQGIWGIPARMTVANYSEISTNLTNDPRGSAQLSGLGIGGSITGKHYDLIFTDDIVNVRDRVSRAERERTKTAFMELQNLRNRGGRIFNTGTPWHVDDCFSIMPKAQRYDCRATGLMTDEQISEVRSHMTPSLFAANYELRHIPSDDVIFTSPRTGAPIEKVMGGECHVDAAYHGDDFTAFSAQAVVDGTRYVYGRMWRKHIDDVMPVIAAEIQRLNLGRMFMETNSDKGYSARAFKGLGVRVVPYPETMNKYMKIVTHLKAAWPDVVFCEGTDQDYINQICDYTEDSEHDDAPDSLASLVQRGKNSTAKYVSKLGL